MTSKYIYCFTMKGGSEPSNTYLNNGISRLETRQVSSGLTLFFASLSCSITSRPSHNLVKSYSHMRACIDGDNLIISKLRSSVSCCVGLDWLLTIPIIMTFAHHSHLERSDKNNELKKKEWQTRRYSLLVVLFQTPEKQKIN